MPQNWPPHCKFCAFSFCYFLSCFRFCFYMIFKILLYFRLIFCLIGFNLAVLCNLVIWKHLSLKMFFLGVFCIIWSFFLIKLMNESQQYFDTAQKRNFSLKISSLSVTKSAFVRSRERTTWGVCKKTCS